jgi:hypothetical protein
MADWVKMWEYVDALQDQRKELYEALVALYPEGWGEEMDHMPGIKKAREAIAKYEAYYPGLPAREAI